MTASLIGDIAGPFALLFGNPRWIGTIIPDVTVEEIHVDAMQITDHPVETGAQISDHAFMMPSEIQMTCGWSNSSALSSIFVKQVYEQLLALQRSRQPFSVSTGKRIYENMLIRNLMVSTSPESENSLMCVVSLRQVIITNTNGGAQGSAMLNPQQTSPIGVGGTIPTLPFGF